MSTSTAFTDSQEQSQPAAAHEATTTAKMAEAAHSAVDIAAANLAQAEQALREAREAAGIKASDTARQAQAVTDSALSASRQYIRENPIRAVGIAMATGYLLSVLLRK